MLLQQLNMSVLEELVEAELGAEVARGAQGQAERDAGVGGAEEKSAVALQLDNEAVQDLQQVRLRHWLPVWQLAFRGELLQQNGVHLLVYVAMAIVRLHGPLLLGGGLVFG